MNENGSLWVAGMALVALLLASSAVAAQPVRGYAAYQVSITSSRGQHSVLVNETIGPSNKAGYSDLVLQLIGRQQNLTYSKLVNASEDLFPYLPSTATQSFRYSNGTAYSVSLNLTDSGKTAVTFKGSQYNLDVLAISVSASYGDRSIRANGTVETFPSALVYSASIGNSTARLQAVLQSTDLSLVAASSEMPTSAYVGLGAGIGALVLGGAFLIRRREKKAVEQKEKPLHWVD